MANAFMRFLNGLFRRKKVQVQCCLAWSKNQYPMNTMRLLSIEMDEWVAMCTHVAQNTNIFPSLQRVIHGGLPATIERAEMISIQEECRKYKCDPNDLIWSALSTIDLFLQQARDQKNPAALFEVWPGKYFETYTIIKKGVDLEADLKELNQIGKQESERSD